VPAWEARWFQAVNGLPDSWHPAVWTVMQLGAYATVPAVAGAALARGDGALARRLAFAGTGAWVGAKVVKRVVRRERPAALVPGTRVLGRNATGGGFPSGHAAVAAALAAGWWSAAPPPARPLLAGAAATVGVARIYVGAHLPLDVVGGAAMGIVIARATETVDRFSRPPAVPVGDQNEGLMLATAATIRPRTSSAPARRVWRNATAANQSGQIG